MAPGKETCVEPLRICVVALGRIGLPIASLLATKGHKVHGVDVDARIVERVTQLRGPFLEPDLAQLLRSAMESGNLSASSMPEAADVFILAVPTPLREAIQPDVAQVFAAADAIAPVLEAGNLVIIESTIPVGTTQALADYLHRARPDIYCGGRLYVAHCPERVLPGKILTELVSVDRVVGGVDPESTSRGVAFFQSFVDGEIVPTDARTAELTKLAENAFRDINIAYANELSMVCAELDLDVWEVITLANRHPRVRILDPGPGVGGHCIAVDPWFLVAAAPSLARLVRAAREVNKEKERWVVERVTRLARRFRDPVVACLGLTYKPDVNDLRESPALAIVHVLGALADVKVLAVDPYVADLPGVQIASLDEAIACADIVVALVAHRVFGDLPREILAEKVVVDTCGVFR